MSGDKSRLVKPLGRGGVHPDAAQELLEHLWGVLVDSCVHEDVRPQFVCLRRIVDEPPPGEVPTEMLLNQGGFGLLLESVLVLLFLLLFLLEEGVLLTPTVHS